MSDRETEPRKSSLLLDEEDAITDQLEACLKHIFAKYCMPAVPKASDATTLLVPPPDAYLAEGGLQKWAVDTNGQPFSDETKEEMAEFFDITDDGCLTFKGFMQLYQLQTESDEEETWKDLAKHGFDRSLKLISEAP